MARKPIKDDPRQSKRFLDLAKEVEATGDSESLERAIKKIGPRARVPLNHAEPPRRKSRRGR